MEGDKNKIKSFEDLIAWKEGHKLVLLTYKLTEKFPRSELFGLISQMNRAAVSITSNIAEGFSRSTIKDKCQFYIISSGSLTELKSEAIVARDKDYISKKEFDEFSEQSDLVGRLITGLKKIGRIQNTKY